MRFSHVVLMGMIFVPSTCGGSPGTATLGVQVRTTGCSSTLFYGCFAQAPTGTTGRQVLR